MPPFDLSVLSFTPPALPTTPNTNTIQPPTSALRFVVSLPHARDARNPLYPATQLQLSYSYEGKDEIFVPVKSEDLIQSGRGENVYEVNVSSSEIPRAKIRQHMGRSAEVSVYAWKGEKVLGKWVLGRVEGLGLRD